MLDPDARAPGQAQPDGLGPGGQPAARSLTNASSGQPDAAMLDALRRAGEELEDRLEGVFAEGPNGSAHEHHHRPVPGHQEPGVRKNLRPTARAACRSQLDPNVKIGNAKVFAIYGKGGIGKSTTSSQPVGGVLQARQARAADRLRSQARLDLHADQEDAADRDRRARDGRLPSPRSCASRTSSSRATTA